MHPLKGCFLIALRIPKPRIPCRYCPIVLRSLFSHSFPSPITYLHSSYTLPVKLPPESSPEIWSSGFFCKSEQNSRVGLLWGRLRLYSGLWVINSKVKLRGSTLYTFLGDLCLLEPPHFLQALVGGQSSRQQMQFTLEYSSSYGRKANPCWGSRPQKRTQVNIWASIQGSNAPNF